MGIIVNKNDELNDELSRRISADLRERAVVEESDPDFAEDAEYVKELKKTGRFSWIWIVLVVLAIISFVSIVMI